MDLWAVEWETTCNVDELGQFSRLSRNCSTWVRWRNQISNQVAQYHGIPVPVSVPVLMLVLVPVPVPVPVHNLETHQLLGHFPSLRPGRPASPNILKINFSAFLGYTCQNAGNRFSHLLFLVSPFIFFLWIDPRKMLEIDFLICSYWSLSKMWFSQFSIRRLLKQTPRKVYIPSHTFCVSVKSFNLKPSYWCASFYLKLNLRKLRKKTNERKGFICTSGEV